MLCAHCVSSQTPTGIFYDVLGTHPVSSHIILVVSANPLRFRSLPVVVRWLKHCLICTMLHIVFLSLVGRALLAELMHLLDVRAALRSVRWFKNNLSFLIIIPLIIFVENAISSPTQLLQHS